MRSGSGRRRRSEAMAEEKPKTSGGMALLKRLSFISAGSLTLARRPKKAKTGLLLWWAERLSLLPALDIRAQRLVTFAPAPHRVRCPVQLWAGCQVGQVGGRDHPL